MKNQRNQEKDLLKDYLETIKNEKKDEHINSSKTKGIKKPKKQMSDEDKKKNAELMKRLRG